jgi:hypothetical protein
VFTVEELRELSCVMESQKQKRQRSLYLEIGQELDRRIRPRDEYLIELTQEDIDDPSLTNSIETAVRRATFADGLWVDAGASVHGIAWVHVELDLPSTCPYAPCFYVPKSDLDKTHAHLLPGPNRSR